MSGKPGSVALEATGAKACGAAGMVRGRLRRRGAGVDAAGVDALGTEGAGDMGSRGAGRTDREPGAICTMRGALDVGATLTARVMFGGS